MEEKISGLQMKDVPDQWAAPDRTLATLADIEQFIELPLRRAIGILVNKGVRTYWSTANRNNTLAFVVIEPQYLSPANIGFAKKTLRYKGLELERIILDLPITPETPAEDVETFFADLAEQFADQKRADV